MNKRVNFPGLPADRFTREELVASPTFVDLFSGCGGLSLGLSMAGLQGLFAVERDVMAFETFSANLLGKRTVPVSKFQWPEWLERKAWAIDTLLSKHTQDLTALRGQVDILAGGPPCQGFSFSGLRQESDPRNLLFKKYVKVVDAVRPTGILLENVPGMKIAHVNKDGDRANDRLKVSTSFYERLRQSLGNLGYAVQGRVVQASSFGVPQKRSRLIVVGIREDVAMHLKGGVARFFEVLTQKALEQCIEFGLTVPVSSADAISDLETTGKVLRPYRDGVSAIRFQQIDHGGPKTKFQKLMHRGCKDADMDSMRLARHRDDVRARFARILEECPKGIHMNEANRKRYGLKKHRIHPMSPLLPAPTITTLPDDVLHYSEPRILTVRESARLQTFPDWFHFRGKYTTGGERRTQECPRYTQVGNAVPPFMARAIGVAILATIQEARENLAKEITSATFEVGQLAIA